MLGKSAGDGDWPSMRLRFVIRVGQAGAVKTDVRSMSLQELCLAESASNNRSHYKVVTSVQAVCEAAGVPDSARIGAWAGVRVVDHLAASYRFCQRWAALDVMH